MILLLSDILLKLLYLHFVYAVLFVVYRFSFAGEDHLAEILLVRDNRQRELAAAAANAPKSKS